MRSLPGIKFEYLSLSAKKQILQSPGSKQRKESQTAMEKAISSSMAVARYCEKNNQPGQLSKGCFSSCIEPSAPL